MGDCYEEWLEEINATAEPQGENPNATPPADPVPIFSEKPIKPLTGGPPRRGKPTLDPVPVVVSGEAAEAIHRAISIKR